MTRRLIVLATLALAACSRTGDSQKGDGPPGPTIARAGEPLPNQYLVVLKPGAAPVTSVVGSLLLGAEGAWAQRTYEHALRGFALHATDAQALAIAGDPRVAWVAEDGRVRAQALTTQANAPAGLDRIDQRAGTDGTFSYFEGAGEGVHAYVVDTGIVAAHVEFAGRGTAVNP